jgi:peroxiredoxin
MDASFDFFEVRAIPAKPMPADDSRRAILKPPRIVVAAPLAVGEAAPDFTLQDSEGKKISLSDFKDKPVVLNFWESTAAVCWNQIPHLDALYRKYKGDGLVVIGVTREIADAAVVGFAKAQISYIALFDGAEAFQSFGVSGIPCTYYIDKMGKVQAREVSFRRGDEIGMEEKTRTLLKGD